MGTAGLAAVAAAVEREGEKSGGWIGAFGTPVRSDGVVVIEGRAGAVLLIGVEKAVGDCVREGETADGREGVVTTGAEDGGTVFAAESVDGADVVEIEV